jgi:hypothetical protein
VSAIVSSYLLLSCLALPCLVLSCLILSYRVVSCRVVSCRDVSCLVFSMLLQVVTRMLHSTLWNSFGTWLAAHRFGGAQIMVQQHMQHMALRQAILRMRNRKTHFAWRGWLNVTVYHQKREHTIRNVVRRCSRTSLFFIQGPPELDHKPHYYYCFC